MERGTHIRKSHTFTSDLLTWSESTPARASSVNASPGAARSNQPSDGISKVFGGQITDEEADSLNKSIRRTIGYSDGYITLDMCEVPEFDELELFVLSGSVKNALLCFRKPCSGYKWKEMTGSNIFSGGAKNGSTESEDSDGNFNNRTSVRILQQATNGISQISFSTEEKLSPKKPSTLTEVAKQRELSGTLESDTESVTKKQLSDAKYKELSGNDIFGPPPEVPPRSCAAARVIEAKENNGMDEPAPRSLRTSVKVSNPAGGQSNITFGDEPIVKATKKIHDQKFAELTGNDIFKGDVPPGSAEKYLSVAKLKEMNGNNIFSDGKVESRDYFGGIRKPPGGESSIALV